MALSIGTCSWKFPSWNGLVYSSREPNSYLAEYAESYRTVEVDQWFWSLFGTETVRLPSPEDVARYLGETDEGFRFGIKVPNSVTLTHLYKQASRDAGKENPHFLSPELMRSFLERIAPMRPRVGSVMLQFEYLNKQKMRGLSEFLDNLSRFFDAAPSDWPYAVETRNPNYLEPRYFDFLATRGIRHVFAHGYYMPPAYNTYRSFRERIRGATILRLLGWDRKGIEEKTNHRWDQLVDPRDEEIDSLAWMTRDLLDRGVEVAVYVNNHFEGSAPRTIDRFLSRLDGVDRRSE